MANRLLVRRVRIQDIDGTGNPDGDPYYGIIASDNYQTVVRCDCASLDELNNEIEDAGDILTAACAYSDGDFGTTEEQRAAIGVDNYHGEVEDEYEDEDDEDE